MRRGNKIHRPFSTLHIHNRKIAIFVFSAHTLAFPSIFLCVRVPVCLYICHPTSKSTISLHWIKLKLQMTFGIAKMGKHWLRKSTLIKWIELNALEREKWKILSIVYGSVIQIQTLCDVYFILYKHKSVVWLFTFYWYSWVIICLFASHFDSYEVVSYLIFSSVHISK